MADPRLTFGRNYTIDMMTDRRVQKQKMVRLRTPDRLPMNHSSAQTRHQAMQQRQRRLDTANDVRKACKDSDNLRQYSKRRFEFAIHNVSPSLDRSGEFDAPRPYTSPNISTSTPGTGPSVHGSLLYNRFPVMLNAIRVRPQSESGKYSHSSRIYPDIDRTLRKSNWEFSVKGTTLSRGQLKPSHSRGCCSSDLMLIPLGNQLDVQDFLPEDSDDDEGYTDSSTFLTLPPRPRVVSDGSGMAVTDKYRSDTHSEKSSEVKTLFTRSSHLISVQDCGSSRSSTLGKRHPQCTGLGETRNRFGVTQTVRSPSCNKGNGNEQSMSGSASSTVSSERPKCWVDDVTISSEVSEGNGELLEIPAVDDNKQRSGKQKNKPEQTKQVRLENTSPTDNILADVNQQEEEGEGEESEAEITCSPQDVFPKFLCPSSERKSRQAAIKLWLASTCFTCADRNVPLF